MRYLFLFLFSVTATAGSYTTRLNLYKPANGDTNYVVPFAAGMDTLDNAAMYTDVEESTTTLAGLIAAETLRAIGAETDTTKPAAILYLTEATAAATSAIASIYWGAENYDNRDMHSTTTSSNTITIPAMEQGLYQVTCSVQFSPVALGGGYRFVAIVYQNTSTIVLQGEQDIYATAGVYYPNPKATGIVYLNSGDTLNCSYYKDATTNLAGGGLGDSYFSVVKIR